MSWRRGPIDDRFITQLNSVLSQSRFTRILCFYLQKTVSTADDWAGRFWGRTGCDSGSQHCESGDCGNKLECAGAGGIPPVTLIEFTLNGWQGLDYYDVSLVDGFNVAAEVSKFILFILMSNLCSIFSRQHTCFGVLKRRIKCY